MMWMGENLRKLLKSCLIKISNGHVDFIYIFELLSSQFVKCTKANKLNLGREKCFIYDSLGEGAMILQESSWLVALNNSLESAFLE